MRSTILTTGDGGELCPGSIPPAVGAVPVNLAPPSITGQPTAGRTLTEGHSAWSPIPTSYSYQWERCNRTGAGCARIVGAAGQTYTLSTAEVGSTTRVTETASAGAASTPATSPPTARVTRAASNAARERAFRACVAGVKREAKHARWHRRLAAQLMAGRNRCVKRWGRIPGRVTGLTAIPRGTHGVELRFSAPGTTATIPPPPPPT